MTYKAASAMQRSLYTLLSTPPLILGRSPLRPSFNRLGNITPCHSQHPSSQPFIRTYLSLSSKQKTPDATHPETQERRGGFGHIFNDLFQQAGDAHDPPLGIETNMHYVVEDGDNPGHVPTIDEIPNDVRAIVISGSMYDAHGNNPWILKLVDLLTQLWQTRPAMRCSGVCFGHQILCRMLGATVEPTSSGR